MSKFYLVDGSGYIFRAFYAITRLTNKEGFPTNALYGFLRMLLKLHNEAESNHLVIVFDTGQKTFRHEMYPEYKANRKECPDELVQQMPYFREISSALGFEILEMPGYEADDIIGTIAKRLSAAGEETVVVSGDKDLMQLVGDRITIWDTMKDSRIGRKEVVEKLGVPPESVCEYLALMGDTSDNVPGLNGVGPKTAAQLVQKYGDILNIINNIKAIETDSDIRSRKKIVEELEQNVEMLRLSRKLVEIDKNVPVKVNLKGFAVELSKLGDSDLDQAFIRKPTNTDQLRDLIKKFEFTSLAREMKLEIGESIKVSAPSKSVLIGKAQFESWFSTFSKRAKDQFYFQLCGDLFSIDPDVPLGIALATSKDEVMFVPFSSRAGDGLIEFNEFKKVAESLLNSGARKIGHGLKPQLNLLSRNGLEVKNVFFDTMIASYLLSPDKRDHSIQHLAHDYLGLDLPAEDAVSNNRTSLFDIDMEGVASQVSTELSVVPALVEKLGALVKEAELEKIFYEIEMPLLSVLSRMEVAGIKLDVEQLSKLSEEFQSELNEIQKKIYIEAGSEFNINSPKQLADILFNKLGIPTQGLKKTKTGISTDSGVLEKIAPLHPLPNLLLRYRLLHKLKTTYVDSLPSQVSRRTGRLHTILNQTGTATGRLSSSDPNLQNIPIQTPEGRRIREAFVSDSGNVLISADYSQIELRILAHLSEDEKLVEAFNKGEDIHARTAREILGIGPKEELTSDLRRIGKTINFGVIYGMGPFRLSRDLGIPMNTAKKYIDNYFARYARVKDYVHKIESEAEKGGVVTTLFGRKRIVSDIDTSGRDQGFAMRAAFNAPLQGTAADIIKKAMVRLDREIVDGLPIKMILQVHDELLFECDEGFREKAVSIIKTAMEEVIKLSVPLRVDIGWGCNWQEAHL